MFWPSLMNLSESVHKVFYTDIVKILCNDESCWCWVKHRVACCSGSCVVVVVVAKRSDQTCFLADAAVNFKVVKQVRSRRRGEFLVELVILSKCKVRWLPKEISLRDPSILRDFLPISSFTQWFFDIPRVVPFSHTKCERTSQCFLGLIKILAVWYWYQILNGTYVARVFLCWLFLFFFLAQWRNYWGCKGFYLFSLRSCDDSVLVNFALTNCSNSI